MSIEMKSGLVSGDKVRIWSEEYRVICTWSPSRVSLWSAALLYAFANDLLRPDSYRKEGRDGTCWNRGVKGCEVTMRFQAMKGGVEVTRYVAMSSEWGFILP